ncbi:MAG TPA: hypothetical protein VGB73_12105 [Pyrinomonadaceae bacterium]
MSEVLATGGALPLRRDEAQAGDKISPRQRGIRQGVMLMMSAMLLVPLVIFVGVMILDAPIELIPLTGVLCVVGGLMRLLYALFFESNAPLSAIHNYLEPYVPPVAPTQLRRPEHEAQKLPPPRSVPVSTYVPPRVNTSEIAPPSSVTDHTTRLLKDEADSETR